MKTNTDTLSIKSWPEGDRPREKLALKGRQQLTDAELVAIIIGSGSKKESAVELSKKILAKYDNNLNNLAKLSITDFMEFKGIGEAKAISIVSALELGRRRNTSTTANRDQITCSKKIFELFHPILIDQPHEEFHILLLNRSNVVIRNELISRGGVSGTLVDPKIIFKSAVSHLACSLILCHNHPSGNLKPSHQDIVLTKKLKSGGALLDITVLDHVIVSDTGYFSFADNGMI